MKANGISFGNAALSKQRKFGNAFSPHFYFLNREAEWKYLFLLSALEDLVSFAE
jgi:hypothetical protein